MFDPTANAESILSMLRRVLAITATGVFCLATACAPHNGPTGGDGSTVVDERITPRVDSDGGNVNIGSGNQANEDANQGNTTEVED